jgi:hypothetical protein
MAFIRARQGVVTRRFPHQGNRTHIVPNRPKLGPPIYPDEGADHTVTLTGPDQEATVDFPTEPGKRYRIFSTVTDSNLPVYTPAYGESLEVATTDGSFAPPPGEENKIVVSVGNPTLYGFTQTVADTLAGTAPRTALHLRTASETDPADYVTFGKFYAREVKAP